MSDHPSHEFQTQLRWTGAAAGPVQDYPSYSRDLEIRAPGKPPLHLSAAPVFRGDGSFYNSEDLLVAALSGCHFLSYAALCARHGVTLVDYADDARGTMAFDRERNVMAFTEVVLLPRTVVAPGTDLELARRLHDRAHHECFIANSVNFPVRHVPEIVVASEA